MKYRKKSHGFTLLELMIVITILGILAAVAYPTFQSTLAQNRAKKGELDLNKAFARARSEAISQNQYIGICPISSKDVNKCATGDDCPTVKKPQKGCSWTNGFITYIDKNKNKKYDSADGTPIQKLKISDPRLSIFLDAENIMWKAGGLAFELDGKRITEGKTITIIPSKDISQKGYNKECKFLSTGIISCQ